MRIYALRVLSSTEPKWEIGHWLRVNCEALLAFPERLAAEATFFSERDIAEYYAGEIVSSSPPHRGPLVPGVIFEIAKFTEVL